MRAVAALPAVSLPFAPFYEKLSTISQLCVQSGAIRLHAAVGGPERLKPEAASAHFLWRTCKRKGMSQSYLAAPLFFHFFPPFQFTLLFSLLNAAENRTAWQSRGGCFSLKRSADGAHSRGKLCKSLH